MTRDGNREMEVSNDGQGDDDDVQGVQERAGALQRRRAEGDRAGGGQDAGVRLYQGVYKLQGVFFDWSTKNLAKSQSLYEIPYSNFFSRILLLVLGPCISEFKTCITEF